MRYFQTVLLALCSILFFMSSALSAQDLKGKVIDEETGNGVERVRIYSQLINIPVFTDAEGRFLIRNINYPIVLIFEKNE